MFAKKTTVTALAAAVLLSATSGLALAQDKQPGPPQKDGKEHGMRHDDHRGKRHHRGMMMGGPAGMFVFALQQFDADKDGKISKDEATGAADKIFAAIDADNDGSLTPGEMRKYREARMEAWKADRKQTMQDEAPAPDQMSEDDGDDQAMAPPPEGDDAGAPRDFGKHHRDRDDRRGGPDDDRGGWHRKGPGHMMGGFRMGHMIRSVDTDENGQISKAEAQAKVDEMFKRFDKNGDGFISADDFPKGPSLLPDSK